MTTKTKLELTWPGKRKRPRLEPRILLEDKALSHRAAYRARSGRPSRRRRTDCL